MEPSASQTLGPFFRHALERPAWSDLTATYIAGERIHILGRLFDGAREAVPDGMIEIWQADTNGDYGSFRGFGRACTDSEGRFSFTTIKPGCVPAAQGTSQAPHINVTIFARGLTKHLNTRIYFSDCASQNSDDPIFNALDDAGRATLLAQRADDAAEFATYHFDIVLQGERETVFLEI